MTTRHDPRRRPTAGAAERLVEGTKPLLDPLVAGARPVVDAVLGDGWRRDVVEGALARLPVGPWRPHRPDLAGWALSEYQAYRSAPSGSPVPPRRAGHEAAALINRLSGVLPPDTVPVARSITDAAPPAGEWVNPPLYDVLERYLPETLRAFNVDAPRELRGPAERLLASQLDLLREATTSLQRAQAENNDRDLQIQAAFLRDRFAELRPGSLDLGTPHAGVPARGAAGRAAPGAGARPTREPEPVRHPSLSLSPVRGRVHVRPEANPVALFGTGMGGDGRLGLRLGLPKGQVATLGVVYETARGIVGFDHTSNRKYFALRRPTGFRSAQVDVTLRLNAAGLRRFLVYAATAQREEPTPTVLFVRGGQQAQADLPTLLTNDPRVPITVVASGFSSREGLLVRNESLVYPDLRGACTAFGYERIEWLDQHTPIV